MGIKRSKVSVVLCGSLWSNYYIELKLRKENEMSRLDPRVEEQNRKAFELALKVEAHAKKVAAWLESRPEVGVLAGKTETYYVYPAGGVYKNVAVFATH